MCIYIWMIICIYRERERPGPRFLAPPADGMVPQPGSPCEWNMHAMQHVHTYAPICMHIHTCVPTSIYACIAPPHIPQGGWQIMCEALARWILWASPRSAPHPTGGGVGCMHIYMHISRKI